MQTLATIIYKKLNENIKATRYTRWPFRYFDGATRLGETNRRFPWIFCRCHEYLLSFGET